MAAILLGFAALSLGSQLIPIFLQVLGLVLIGYAFLGRGFAYVGHYPIYVGELTLGLALLSLLVMIRRFAHLSLLHVWIFLFMIWGAIRTLPYLSRYGLVAFRDAVVWEYAIIALAVSVAAQPKHFMKLATWYARLAPVFVVWVPLAAILFYIVPSLVPIVPSTDVRLVYFKPGDMGVHLGAAAAFVLLGLSAIELPRPSVLRLIPFWPAWFLSIAIVGALGRGGLLAATFSVGGALMLRSSDRRSGERWRFLVMAGLIVVALAVINPHIDVGRGRPISFSQIAENLGSIISSKSNGPNDLGGLQQNKEWRLRWWTEIVDYTIHGRYFWTGKGFGINLATDDGFQINAAESLRAPHSVHFSVLARMGVPGLLLWLLLQATFGISLLRAAVEARGRDAPFWALIDTWLFLYWVAFIVNASFDVYLEGPQGGIWFWAVVGLGMAALRIQHAPELTAMMSGLTDVKLQPLADVRGSVAKTSGD